MFIGSNAKKANIALVEFARLSAPLVAVPSLQVWNRIGHGGQLVKQAAYLTK